ncbi:MAG: rhomboid family intramembrane serine protease [Cytobacillus gottheilii]|uniref:rhomboid family intramembrane serine protease n=1 Tax=Cytobacillus gottheilii TaxID=859144 RepID=UPI00082EE677|nr:rhomboid family intramembrane serine protease [Cytobacillus gottheilii]
MQEEYMFWRLAWYFISDHDFRIVQLGEGDKELWLEKMENKQLQVIRLLRYDLDWSSWMERDIEHTAANGERIRKQLAKKQLGILNIYISPYPPVDDYEYRLEAPFQLQEGSKTEVTTMIMAPVLYEKETAKLNSLFSSRFDIPAELHTDPEEIENLKQKTLAGAVKKEKEEQAVFRAGKPLFTYAFIAIQVLMFLLLEWKGGSTNTSTLIQYGAKFNPLILEGEWWRFFTPIVLHIGLVHLLMNTLALFYLGAAVERIFGSIRFFLIYLIAGFSGTLASFIFSDGLSAGASGAIFGCFGALIYFGFMYKELFFRTIGMNIIVVLGINLVLGFVIPGIDNAGHIGGMIGGFLAAAIVHLPKKKNMRLQVPALLLTALIFGALLWYGFSDHSKVVDEQSLMIAASEYIDAGEHEKVIELLEEPAQSEDASANVLFQLAYAEIHTGKMTEAKEHLQGVIEKNDQFHEAYYNLALIYLNENNVAEAKELVTRAIELENGEELYTNLLEQINQYESGN